MTGFFHFPALDLLLPLALTPDKKGPTAFNVSSEVCPSFEMTEVESNHHPLDRQVGALTTRPALPMSMILNLKKVQ